MNYSPLTPALSPAVEVNFVVRVDSGGEGPRKLGRRVFLQGMSLVLGFCQSLLYDPHAMSKRSIECI